MPTYLYRCSACLACRDVVKKLIDLDREEPCYVCAVPMDRQISAPAVAGDFAGYECPISGAWIQGRRAHEENLKKHGCRVYEPGETEAAKRGRIASDEALDASVEATAEAFVHALPVQKREQLAVELQQGATTEVVRSTKTE